MTTELQTQSNRRNAQASTGPVSEAGRARLARNALRHGYYATDIVMPAEDAAQFDRLLAGIRGDWAPASDSERELTDEIAVALWRRRLRRTEAELWAERTESADGQPRSLGHAFAEDSQSIGNAIEKLRRWWQGNERHLNRCLDKLALIKRLAGHGSGSRPPEEVLERRRDAAREIDLLMSAPLPGDVGLPILGAGDHAHPVAPHEIGKSAEPTQSHNIQEDKAVAATVSASPAPVSEDSPPARQPLSRRERRALERQQVKARRQQGRAAA